MAKSVPKNPFSTTTYLGPEYFCDREQESKRMLNALTGKSSITLLSPRRIGKTGLIRHVLSQLPKGFHGIYIDILHTENLAQFLNQISTALLNAVKERSTLGTKIWGFFKSLRPAIGFDTLTGTPYATFDVKGESAELNITSILNFLDSTGEQFIIAIDEFQQILNYPEKQTDAWLRTQMQSLKNVVFIFSGSQQHLMIDLFTKPQRPFFRSTDIMKLNKIDAPAYAQFIVDMFERYNKLIDSDTAFEILDWCETHTYYVQSLCKQVFSASPKKVTTGIWKQQAITTLKEQEIVFLSFRNLTTTPQWQLLKAIASEKIVYMPTAKEFLTKYDLGTSATVLRSLDSLQKFELIYSDFNANGKKFYSIYDVWFKRWIEHKN